LLDFLNGGFLGGFLGLVAIVPFGVAGSALTTTLTLGLG
jgi:hypothetical protein